MVPRFSMRKLFVLAKMEFLILNFCMIAPTITLQSPYTEPKRATSFAEEYLINGCMAARGYTVTW